METAPIAENAAQVNNAAPPRGRGGRGGRDGRGAQNGQVGHGGSAGAATVQGNPNPNGFSWSRPVVRINALSILLA